MGAFFQKRTLRSRVSHQRDAQTRNAQTRNAQTRDAHDRSPQVRGPKPLALRIAFALTAGAAVSAVATWFVWFLGFDWVWAIATVLAVGSVGVVLSTLKFEEQTSWDPPGRETPRGIRLAMPLMEESLAACDRLARPAITRPIRVLLTNERDDRLARGTMLRQMRALLVAVLRVHGIDPTRQPNDAVIALLGPDALTVLEPNDDNPVTTATIANCLDAVERLHLDPNASQ